MNLSAIISAALVIGVAPVKVPILPVPVASDLMVTGRFAKFAVPGLVTWKVASGLTVIEAEAPKVRVPPVIFAVPVLVTRKIPFTVWLVPNEIPTVLFTVKLLTVAG